MPQILTKKIFGSLVIIFLALCFFEAPGFSYSANRIHLQKYENIYRLVINYTVPELKEYREAIIEFRSKKKANEYYYKLLSGAEFDFSSGDKLYFPKIQTKPQPW